MAEPHADRPRMPDFGLAPPDGGSGLLPWSAAIERIRRSHDFWLATSWPDGRPHLMPVWAVWHDDAVWFCTGLRSRKALNLAADARCSLATDDAHNPLVMEGTAHQVTDLDHIRGFLDAMNSRYETDYQPDFVDPAVNGSYRLVIHRAVALTEEDLSGSATRWRFPL